MTDFIVYYCVLRTFAITFQLEPLYKPGNKQMSVTKINIEIGTPLYEARFKLH